MPPKGWTVETRCWLWQPWRFEVCREIKVPPVGHVARQGRNCEVGVSHRTVQPQAAGACIPITFNRAAKSTDPLGGGCQLFADVRISRQFAAILGYESPWLESGCSSLIKTLLSAVFNNRRNSAYCSFPLHFVDSKQLYSAHRVSRRAMNDSKVIPVEKLKFNFRRGADEGWAELRFRFLELVASWISENSSIN